MHKPSIALALAAMATFAAPVYAASSASESVSVTYRDLDLTTEEGQKALEGRLDKAAREVCGINETRTGTRIASRDARSCYDQARDQLAERFAEVVNQKRRGG